MRERNNDIMIVEAIISYGSTTTITGSYCCSMLSRLRVLMSVCIILYCCCYDTPTLITTTTATAETSSDNTVTCTANEGRDGGGGDGDDRSCQNNDLNDDNNNNNNNDHHRRTNSLHVPPSDCKVYIAKSTIPNAGLGIFNGYIPKRTGDDTLSQHGGDICIPIIDAILHGYDQNDPYSVQSDTPFPQYYWGGFVMGMYTNSILYDGSGIEAFCPGFDTLINCHLGLTHLLYTSIPQYDDLSIPNQISNYNHHHHHHHYERYHRSTHPGVGAFTPYYNGTSRVKALNVYIPPYTELFKDYGDHWFESRSHIFGNIPLSNDYHNIHTILQKFNKLRITQNALLSVKKYNGTGVTINNNNNNNNTATNDVAVYLYETLLHRIKNIYDSRTLNALPPKYDDAIYVGSSTSRDKQTKYLLQQHTTNLHYLQQYGTCIDQIRSGRSTLFNAGRGGYATRYFYKDTIITAAPLLIIPNKVSLEMYHFIKYNYTWFRDYKKRKHYQLLYNYCYGHRNSVLLLCPHGGGVNYINHNQSLVNVKIEWTTTQLSFVHNAALVQNGTLTDLNNLAHMQQGTHLVFQYVATRDIQPGEELFLDYGDEWEKAWQYHVEHYPYSNNNDNNDNDNTQQQLSPTYKYVSAHEYNYYHQDTLIRTIEEQKIEPYPNNLQIRCHRSLFTSFSNAVAIYEWAHQDYGLSCRILDRWIESNIITSSLHMDLYTVQIEYIPGHTVAEQHYSTSFDATDHHQQQQHNDKAMWIIRTDVPRSAIRFFDIPYTTDIHQPYTFRHSIQIPDDIFPPQWQSKDLKT